LLLLYVFTKIQHFFCQHVWFGNEKRRFFHAKNWCEEGELNMVSPRKIGTKSEGLNMVSPRKIAAKLANNRREEKKG
jgi:hypothetical protein